VRHYCRSCDEFVTECRCLRVLLLLHEGHRVYIWTPGGVVARPDFDVLLRGEHLPNRR
jgi:hypothetical protein